MFTSRLDGDRIFGRIYELDLECGNCGETWYLNSTGRSLNQIPGRKKRWSPGPYNFRTGRFTCPSCQTTFGIGVYMFPIDDRHGEQPPVDWVPTYRQGVALREQTTGRIDNSRGYAWEQPKNTCVREGCTCRIRGQGVTPTQKNRWGVAKKPIATRFIISPSCPIHGGLVEPGPTPPGGKAVSVPAGTEIVTLPEPQDP